MKELLKFWNLVNDTFGSEDIELAAEEWDFEIEKYTKKPFKACKRGNQSYFL